MMTLMMMISMKILKIKGILDRTIISNVCIYRETCSYQYEHNSFKASLACAFNKLIN